MHSQSLLTIGLLAVLCLVGCAPVALPPTTQPTPLLATVPPVEPSLLPTPTMTSLPIVEPTETVAPTDAPLPVATSRGPNLEATDPSTVSLNAGDLQFVEFFRFT